ncbi:MAG: matrixin family metalloprotease [Candidatus Diapherotrites archaeon]|nr:matrixin family metalloprotease [Candidatus Diapherotrites archaeon]
MESRKLLLISLSLVFLLAFSQAAMALPISSGGETKALSASDKLLGVERIDFIHYAKGKDNAAGKGAKAAPCYKLMGYSWKTRPINYSINTSNPQGLSQSFIVSAISTSAETWDASTSAELFNNSYSIDPSATYGVRDGKNSIAFGPYSNNGVIAIASIWFSNKTKQIVEFDQLYNTYFQWGDATANPALMDLQNIATHELGHAVGLNDIYTQQCSAVTMYGYSSEGEISKRTLEQADITGLRSMYGT